MAMLLRSASLLKPASIGRHWLPRKRRWPQLVYKLAPSLCTGRTLLARRLAHSTTFARVMEDGRKLSLACTGESDERSFHPVWLRHNCHCTQCLQFWCQKTVPHSDLSSDLKISAAAVEGKPSQVIGCGPFDYHLWCHLPTGDKLVVSWTNGGGDHTGFLPIEWLKENDYSMLTGQRAQVQPLVVVCCLSLSLSTACSTSSHHILSKDHIPRVSYSEALETDEGLWK